jgi:hypothetical protein
VHDIYAKYIDGNYDGNWMSQDFAMSYEELEQYQMTVNPTDSQNVIALKDFTRK